jgi:hypothetical protein
MVPLDSAAAFPRAGDGRIYVFDVGACGGAHSPGIVTALLSSVIAMTPFTHVREDRNTTRGGIETGGYVGNNSEQLAVVQGRAG